MWWYTPGKWTDELLSVHFHRWWCGEGGTLLGVQADLESKELGSLCKAESYVLQGSFGVGNEGSVVSEEEVMEQLLYFFVGMQSPEFKQTAVKAVVDVYSTVIVKVFYDLFKHHAEKDAELSQCQNTTLFHAIND